MKRKKITIKKYNQIMDKISKEKAPVAETLIKMLAIASRYELIEERKK